MKIFRRIASVTSAVLMMAFSSITAFAHSDCLYSGTYLNNNQSNLKFLINPSALTSTITSSYYTSIGSYWNNISSNVSVSATIYYSGMPTSGFFWVYGESIPVGGYTVWGYTTAYNSYGNSTSMDSNWAYVNIHMNTSAPYSSGSSNTPAVTFAHEVGHSLKLNHPAYNSSLLYHSPNYYPSSIMLSGSPYATTYTTLHDRYELKYKWGN